jgi:hypothetical protein
MGNIAQHTSLAVLLGLGVAGAGIAGCDPGGRDSTAEVNIVRVISTDPACGSAGGFLDQPIKIRFNTAIDPNSVSAGTVKITDPAGSTVPGTHFTQHDTVIFTPTNNFLPNTQYTLQVKGEPNAPFMLLSIGGDSLYQDFFCSFTIGTQFVFDNTPPVVQNIFVSGDAGAAPQGASLISLTTCQSSGGANCTPPIGPTGVSPWTSVVMDFDEGMLLSSFTSTQPNGAGTDSFQLWQRTGAGSPQQVAGTFLRQQAGRRITFLPNGALVSSATYEVILTTGVTDDSSNPGPNPLAGANILASFQTRTPLATPASSPLLEDFQTSNGNALGNNTTGGGEDTLNTTATWDTAFVGTFNGALVSNLSQLLTGDGSDGAVTLSGTVTLDTSGRPNGYNYSSFTVNPGAIVSFTGVNPAVIRAQTTISISGTIIVGKWPAGVGTPPNPDPVDGGNQLNFNAAPALGGNGIAGGGNGGGATATVNAPAAQGQGFGAGTGGVSGDPNGTPQVVPGGGGGGSHRTAGSSGPDTTQVLVSGVGGGSTGGIPGSTTLTLPPTITNLIPGSGGGGGGMDDDSPVNQIGDGQSDSSDDTGAGGAAGSGAIRLSAGGNINISGGIFADGGTGGHYCAGGFAGQCPPTFFTQLYNGAAGGGGSAGVIFVQSAGALNVTGSTLSVVGGGQGLSTSMAQPLGNEGGAGGDGWLVLQDLDGSILGSYNNTPSAIVLPQPYTGAPLAPAASGTAEPPYGPAPINHNLTLSTTGQSLWYDSGLQDPNWEDTSPAPVVNAADNQGIIRIYVQGADADGTGNPDSTTFTNWILVYTESQAATTPSFNLMNGNAIAATGLPAGTSPTPGSTVIGLLNAVDRMRFLRFHVQFTNDPAQTVVGTPEVYTIQIGFTN